MAAAGHSPFDFLLEGRTRVIQIDGYRGCGLSSYDGWTYLKESLSVTR